MPKLRLIYVPTHRDCSQVLNQRLQEAAWANEQFGNTAVFCLIENSLSNSVSKAHSKILKKDTSGVRVIHFREPMQQEFVVNLLAHKSLQGFDQKRLNELLMPSGISYGRGPNLAYLLATSLYAESLHRRDSDVVFDETRPFDMPIELEIGAINKLLKDITLPIRNHSKNIYPEKAKVAVVGSGIFGDAAIDRRDLAAADRRFLVNFQSLGRPGVPHEEIEKEAINYLIKEVQARYSEDFYELDLTGRVEMDAVCIAILYKYLPEMPTDIIGCDYMVNDLAWRMRQPSLFHSRKMHHVYDASRSQHKDETFSVNYALRDVQYIQIGRIWSQAGSEIQNHYKSRRRKRFDPAHYVETWRKHAAASADILREVRLGAREIYIDAAKATDGLLSQRLRAVADGIESAGESMDFHVLNTINDYLYLVEAWQSLISAAQRPDAVLPKTIYTTS